MGQRRPRPRRRGRLPLLRGPSDDIILSSGYRIGPFEVESALLSHPDVAEAAAVAAPDPERGAVVRAIVVPRNREPERGAGARAAGALQTRRPPPTSSPASSSSRPSYRRPRAARSSAPSCAAANLARWRRSTASEIAALTEAQQELFRNRTARSARDLRARGQARCQTAFPPPFSPTTLARLSRSVARAAGSGTSTATSTSTSTTASA